MEGTMMAPVQSSALESQVRGEIDIQIATAHRFPRVMKEAIDKAKSLATLTPDIAASCGYALPRAGKVIRGPSVRLAEIIGSCWGNVRYGARVIDIQDKFIVAQGMCHDLESNVAIQHEVRRRITNSSGKRYSDDMIVVTGNAACSVALREAIFRVIPRAIAQPIYEEALKVAAGDMKSLVESRATAMGYLAQVYGVQEDRVLGAIGRESLDEITMSDVADLRTMANTLKEGEMTVEEMFPEIKPDVFSKPAAPPQPPAVPPQAAPEPQALDTSGAKFRSRRHETFQGAEKVKTAGIVGETLAAIRGHAEHNAFAAIRDGYYDKVAESDPSFNHRELTYLRQEEGVELLGLLENMAPMPTDNPEGETPKAQEPTGLPDNLIICQGPNQGDQMDPMYCDTKCGDRDTCPEFDAFQKQTPPKVF